MATTDYQLASTIAQRYPHSIRPLQRFVKDLANLYKKSGKKSFAGKDKGEAAYGKMALSLDKLLVGMVQDHIFERDAPVDEIRNELIELMATFSDAYPNWQEAYEAFVQVFVDEPDQCNELIEQIVFGR